MPVFFHKLSRAEYKAPLMARRTLLILSFLVSAVSLAGCAPKGYDRVLALHGGDHMNYYQDPSELADFGAQWALNPAKSLAFFIERLDSSDSREVKASMLCIGVLACCVDERDAQLAAGNEQGRLAWGQVESAFDAAFPEAKLKSILIKHPEYAEWLYAIRNSARGRAFPEVQAWKPPLLQSTSTSSVQPSSL